MSKIIITTIGLFLGITVQSDGMDLVDTHEDAALLAPTNIKSLFINMYEGKGLDPAGWYNLGCESLDAKNYDQAYKCFKKGADKGNGDAQNGLGYLYAKGMGVTADSYWAAYYYKKSADQGNASAQNNIGSLYERGQGVGQNYETARYYYMLSAEQGNVNAKLSLAHLYECGKVLGNNVDDASNIYKELAEKGNPRALCHLGLMHKKGRGVPKNVELAITYFQSAAKLGNEQAQSELRDLFQDVPDDDQEIDRAIAFLESLGYGNSSDKADLAIDYLVSIADLGNVKAQYGLAKAYIKGWGVSLCIAEATKYFSLAALQGHEEALERLSAWDKRKGIIVRMELAHKGDLSHREFFRTIGLKNPELDVNEQQKTVDKIESLLSKLIEIDNDYVTINTWSAGENTEIPSTPESYMGLFKTVQNSHLKRLSGDVSLCFERIMKAIRLLHEAGTCITCLDFKKDALSKIQRICCGVKGYNTEYFCFTDFEAKSIGTESLQKYLTEMRVLFFDNLTTVQKLKKPTQLLETIDLVGTANPTIAFLNCYAQHFPKGAGGKIQEKFITELGEFFKESYAKIESDLTYAKNLEAKLIALMEDTTIYRNDVFMKYVVV